MTADVLTVKQVSKRLGIGINQAYDACERNLLPCVRFGRRWLIPTAAFEKWLSMGGLTNSQETQTRTSTDGIHAVDTVYEGKDAK